MPLGARRKQELLAIDVAKMFVQTDKAILFSNETLKHTNAKMITYGKSQKESSSDSLSRWLKG